MAMKDSDKYGFRTGAGRPVETCPAIFPIFKRPVGSEDPWEGVGTGFFVTDFGLFLTATHVLEDLDPEREEMIVLHAYPEERAYNPRPVIRGYARRGTDVAAGLVMPLATGSGDRVWNVFMAVCAETPAVNDVVFSFGFPFTLVVPNAAPDLHFVALEPFWTDGIVQQHFRDGRDRVMQPGCCFETDLESYGGSSGAPVMDRHGRAFGVISSSFDDGRPTYVSPIAEILELPVPAVGLRSRPGQVPLLRDLLPFRGLAPLPSFAP